MEIKAYSKINLLLRVLGEREDGYHELETIMHTIDLYDIVRIEKSDKIRVSADVELPENNISKKAVMLYSEFSEKSSGIKVGAEIFIKCAIPSQSGLGSASADCSAVLKGLDVLYGTVDKKQLYEIALMCGADVPFQLMGGCAYAGGIGEKLVKLNKINADILLVKPEDGISTKYLFDRVNCNDDKLDRETIFDVVNSGDVERISKIIENSLEDAAIEYLPVINDIKNAVLEYGALSSCMTGSGSCVYGIFKNRLDAVNAEKNIKKIFKNCFTYVGKTV